jgi:hydroxyacylglutathione hydrolase
MMKNRTISLPLLTFLLVGTAHAQFPEPNGGDLEPGTLSARWMTGGPKCMEVPEWQVHEYNPDLYILRQSGCSDAEMPFLYLFFGKERSLLWDTGSRKGNLAPTLARTVHNWLERNHRESISLIVTHSHSHEDHTWGDRELEALHDPAMPIEYIAPTVEAAAKFFKIDPWPTGTGTVDLGARQLEIVPIPGHDRYAIALYDRRTGILLTGDNLYPGRLYIPDFPTYKASTERLIHFLDGKPVAFILGNHIEETRTPFKDFPIGSIYHPDEHALELPYGALLELEDGLMSMEHAPRRMAFADFTIWPLDPGAKGLGPEMEEIYKRTQAEQLANKWNQPGK